jgi:hypothetical protein
MVLVTSARIPSSSVILATGDMKCMSFIILASLYPTLRPSHYGKRQKCVIIVMCLYGNHNAYDEYVNSGVNMKNFPFPNCLHGVYFETLYRENRKKLPIYTLAYIFSVLIKKSKKNYI